MTRVLYLIQFCYGNFRMEKVNSICAWIQPCEGLANQEKSGEGKSSCADGVEKSNIYPRTLKQTISIEHWEANFLACETLGDWEKMLG